MSVGHAGLFRRSADKCKFPLNQLNEVLLDTNSYIIHANECPNENTGDAVEREEQFGRPRRAFRGGRTTF